MSSFVTRLTERLVHMPRRAKQGVFVAFDSVAGLAATWMAFSVRYEVLHIPVGRQWILYAASMVVFLPAFIRLGLYRALLRFNNQMAANAIIVAVLIHAALFLTIFTVFYRPTGEFPRTVTLLQPIFFGVFVFASRFFVRSLVSGLVIPAEDHKRIVLYGATAAGAQIASALAQSRDYRVVAFVDDDPQKWGSSIGNRSIFSPQWLKLAASRSSIDEVIIADRSLSRAHLNRLTATIRSLGLRANWIPAIEDLVVGRFRVAESTTFDPARLLGRPMIMPNGDLMRDALSGRTVLVTGAGGSIGSELCRQAIAFGAAHVIMLDQSERLLYAIYQESRHLADNRNVRLSTVLASVRFLDRMREAMLTHRPDVVLHAAAYKHVDIVEDNPAEGLKTNFFGTCHVARAAMEAGVARFVLVSTDKAVRPASIMGASKRLAEFVVQAFGAAPKVHYPGAEDATINRTVFCAVRFGNVLDSSGSVVPVFRKQITAGGPVTVTDREVTRYFMAIPEAAQLVIQAGAMAKGGEIYVLDMGKPVRIIDLARRMIEQSGFSVADEDNPGGDIEIRITGLRPGEKLHEELLVSQMAEPTQHPMISRAMDQGVDADNLFDVITTMAAPGHAAIIPPGIADLIDYRPDRRSTAEE